MIEFRIEGLDKAFVAVSTLSKFEAKSHLTVMANLMRTQTLRHFQEQAGPAGPFAPLRPSTIRQKRGGAGQILVDIGRLRGSIGSVVSGTQAEVGTNVFYAKFHQFGTRKMAARPFVGFTERDADEVRDVTGRFLASLMGGR